MATKKKATKKNAGIIKVGETIGTIAGKIAVKKDQLVHMASDAVDAVKSTLHDITAPAKKATKKATATVKKAAKKAVKKAAPAKKAVKKKAAAVKKTAKKAVKKVVKKAAKKAAKKK